MSASLLMDINRASTTPREMKVAGDRLFHMADLGPGHIELYSASGIPGVGSNLVRGFRSVGTTSGEESGPRLVTLGDRLYFAADDGTNDGEVWRSDGFTATQVTDLPAELYPRMLTPAGGGLYFVAGSLTQEFWYTDGTRSGTRPLASTSFLGRGWWCPVGSRVFYASESWPDAQLNWSDGTAGGVGSVAFPDTGLGQFTAAGSLAFFIARPRDAAGGHQLWRSDGTAAGTFPVLTMAHEAYWSDFDDLTAVGDALYFTVSDGLHGRELWRSDGTAAGTELVEDIRPGVLGSEPANLTAAGSTLYFTADDGVHGRELWSAAGTDVRLVEDLRPGPQSSLPAELTAGGATLYFTADDGQTGVEPWRLGPGARPTLVLETVPGPDTALPRALAGSSRWLYFVALPTFETEQGIWAADATTNSHVRLPSSPPRAPSAPSVHSFVGEAGGRVVFVADDGIHGRELWATDGTTDGTVLLNDLRPGGDVVVKRAPNTPYEGLVAIPRPGGLYLLVSGEDEAAGLWTTDGTPAGTRLLRSIANLPSGEGEFALLGDEVYFASGLVPDATATLWRTDGTVAGTVPVRTFTGSGATGRSQNTLSGLRRVGASLLFFVDDGTHGRELWASDGTAAGTRLVKDIRPGAEGADVIPLAVEGPWLYFLADDGVHGLELWRSDGSEAGTVLVKDIRPGAEGSAPQAAEPRAFVMRATVGPLIYFVADDGTHGYELWRSDGTAGGTFLVKDIHPGPDSTLLQDFTTAGALLFFNAETTSNGGEMWRSDGTTGGTFLVKDVRPGPGGSYPRDFVVLGSTLLFTAHDGTGVAYEYWRSDGTIAGTWKVRAVNAQPPRASNLLLLATATHAYFRADDGVHGEEVWRTDGTAAGTRLVGDLLPGPQRSDPVRMAAMPGSDNQFIVFAQHPEAGLEPFVLELPPPVAPRNDFDGDRKSDYAVFRTDDATQPGDLPRWYTLLNRSDRAAAPYDWARQWGLVGDVPVPADYDGDGMTDYTVFRPVDPTLPGQPATWYLALNRGAGQEVGIGRWALPFGRADDVPVPGDYDGDGRADLALYRPSEGRFYVMLDPLGAGTVADNGLAAWDPVGVPVTGGTPVAGDFDDDGRNDFAVYQIEGGLGYWRIRLNRADGSRPYATQSFGLAGDVPVAGDFDGNGRADFVVYRPHDRDLPGYGAVAGWYTWLNLGLVASAGIPAANPANRLAPYDWGRLHGTPNDIPITGDYNGDGKSDYAVYRPEDRTIAPYGTVAAWYTVLNLGDGRIGTWDWGRLHGFPADLPLGRNPLPTPAPVATGSVRLASTSASRTVAESGVVRSEGLIVPVAVGAEAFPGAKGRKGRRSVRGRS